MNQVGVEVNIFTLPERDLLGKGAPDDQTLDFLLSVGVCPGREELGKLREKHIQDSRPISFRPTAKAPVLGGSKAVSFHPTVKTQFLAPYRPR